MSLIVYSGAMAILAVPLLEKTAWMPGRITTALHFLSLAHVLSMLAVLYFFGIVASTSPSTILNGLGMENSLFFAIAASTTEVTCCASEAKRLKVVYLLALVLSVAVFAATRNLSD